MGRPRADKFNKLLSAYRRHNAATLRKFRAVAMQVEQAGTTTEHARDIEPADRYLQQAIATALGLSVRRVHQLTTRGILTRNPDGSYSLTKAVEQYVLFREKSAQAKSQSAVSVVRTFGADGSVN
jgi:hypothetical protein